MSKLGDTPVPFGAQPTERVSAPPPGAVTWIVTLRSDPKISARVTAQTAYEAHLAARLGPFSEVICTTVERKANRRG